MQHPIPTDAQGCMQHTTGCCTTSISIPGGQCYTSYLPFSEGWVYSLPFCSIVKQQKGRCLDLHCTSCKILALEQKQNKIKQTLTAKEPQGRRNQRSNPLKHNTHSTSNACQNATKLLLSTILERLKFLRF